MLVNNYKDNLVSFLLILALFAFVFFPNVWLDGKINASLFLAFSSITFFLSFFYVELRGKIVITSVLLVSVAIFVVKFSLYPDYEFYRVSDYVRFLLYFFVTVTLVNIKRFGFYRILPIIFFVLEFAFVIIQIVDISLTSNIYDVSKVGATTAAYTQFRFTGTLSNPNVLGIFFVYLVALTISWKTRFLYYILLLAFTFLSGSRTSFIMALISIFIYEFSSHFCFKRLMKMSVFFFSLLCFFGGVVYFYTSDFYYFAQISVVIRDFFNGDGFSAFNQVSSLMTRFTLWSEYVSDWVNGGPWVWLLGLPDIEMYRYADNSYIFLLTKYGLIMGGAVFYCLVRIYCKYITYFRDNEAYGRTIFWISFSLLSGVFSDILVSYYYWIMLATFPLMVKKSEEA